MTRKRLRFLAPLFAAGLVATVAACDPGDDDDDGPDTTPGEFPREETLYTTGTEWGSYSNWNPLAGGGQATGAQGLIYESLFIFDPHTAELEPWLAESGEWIADDTYEIRLREGIEWSDGEPLTADDVVFTLDLREHADIPYSTLADWMDSAEAVDELTVQATFSDPRAGEWDNWLYSEQIVAEHTWSDIAGEGITDDPGTDRLVGTGPYLYNSHAEDRAVFERNDDWWGTDALGLEMSPRYIVDFQNAGNEVVIPQLQNAEIDISNNFLPADTLDHEDIGSYFDGPPYMLSWNTAYLLPNHDRAPMDDSEFRRALAHAMDIDDIVNTAYDNLVTAADPTGLLPVWTDQGFVDDGVVSEHGFSYDPAEAEQILDDAGYSLDGDWRTSPDGEEIELTLIVPAGWTDWNIAAEILAESFQAVGLNVTTDFPEASTVDEMRDQGDYDLVVNNWTDLDNTPWDLYNYLFQMPVEEIQSANNFHRYENDEAWALTGDLGRLAVGDPDTAAEFDDILSQLQEISLTDMPAIPMWYNGLWAQWNTTVWTNWPSGADDGPYPSTWNGAWEKGSIYMLAELEPAG